MNISGKKPLYLVAFRHRFRNYKNVGQKGASKILAVSRNPDKVKEIPQNVELVKLDVLDEDRTKNIF